MKNFSVVGNTLRLNNRFWNPDRDSVEALREILRDLGMRRDGEGHRDVEMVEMDSLPIASAYRERVDRMDMAHLWTVDYEGNALVGEEADDIEDIDDLEAGRRG